MAVWNLGLRYFLNNISNILSAVLYSIVQNAVFTEESTNVCKLYMDAHIHGIQSQHAVKIDAWNDKKNIVMYAILRIHWKLSEVFISLIMPCAVAKQGVYLSDIVSDRCHAHGGV